jgi:hypothetical protein
MDYSNLDKKTFLEFTDDSKVIEQIIGDTSKDEFKKGLSEYGRYITFLEFAEITKNNDLSEEVQKQLGHVENE